MHQGGVVGWLFAHGLELAVEKRRQKQVKGETPVDAEFKIIPSLAQDPLTIPVSIGHDEGEEPCFMEWPDLERESPGVPWIYTHRVFRIRVKNNSSTETAEGVNVILLRVGGIQKHHEGKTLLTFQHFGNLFTSQSRLD